MEITNRWEWKKIFFPSSFVGKNFQFSVQQWGQVLCGGAFCEGRRPLDLHQGSIQIQRRLLQLKDKAGHWQLSFSDKKGHPIHCSLYVFIPLNPNGNRLRIKNPSTSSARKLQIQSKAVQSRWCVLGLPPWKNKWGFYVGLVTGNHTEEIHQPCKKQDGKRILIK